MSLGHTHSNLSSLYHRFLVRATSAIRKCFDFDSLCQAKKDFTCHYHVWRRSCQIARTLSFVSTIFHFTKTDRRHSRMIVLQTSDLQRTRFRNKYALLPRVYHHFRNSDDSCTEWFIYWTMEFRWIHLLKSPRRRFSSSPLVALYARWESMCSVTKTGWKQNPCKGRNLLAWRAVYEERGKLS